MPSVTRVGTCLAAPFWETWLQGVRTAETVAVVRREGYNIPFHSPHFLPLPISFQMYGPSPKCQALETKLRALPQKDEVEPSDRFPGCYAWMFVVHKTAGGWRPTIDLWVLNRYVKTTTFKMEIVQLVLLTIDRGIGCAP